LSDRNGYFQGSIAFCDVYACTIQTSCRYQFFR
jgi:hypothetical protein